MKRFSLIMLALIGYFSNINGQGIEFFHGTWQEAIAKAKTEDKLLFVDSYAEWCGPCKSMAKNVFTKEEVGKYFNLNFVNLKLDMEKEDGVSFGHKYPVRAYPTLFFLNGDGKVVKNAVGGQQVQTLLSLAMDANKANDKSIKYEELYNKGDRSYDLMMSYVGALNASDKPSLKISNEYLNSKPNITEKERLAFIMEAAVDADSKMFETVVTEKDKMIGIITEDKYYEKCKSALDKGLKKAIEFEVEDMVYSLTEKAEKTLGPDEGEVWGLKAKMDFFVASKNAVKFASTYKTLAKVSKSDAPTLRSIAITIMKHYKSDKNMIKDAADYIEKVYELNPTQDAMSELVNVMISANEVNRAIKIVTKEKEKALEEKKDISSFTNMLDYLNSKKA